MISVIVPTYNTEKTIRQCIKSLLKQSYSKNKYEIIVVDDGSDDNTVNILRNFKKVKPIEQKHKGPASARNFGVKKSKGDIILFTDSDCVAPRNWIRNMIEPFSDKEVVGVSGTYKTLNTDSLIARFAGYEIEERHGKLKKQKYIDFIGTFSAGYRKNIFLRFNGFDEKFPHASGEDPELSFRMSKGGYKLVFQPKAFVYHKHPDNIFKFLRKKFWNGYWRVLLYKKHKEKIFKHSYTPKSLFVEEALIGITSLLIFLGLLKLISLYFGILFLVASLLFTLPFSFKVFLKDRIVGVLSPLIIILRNFFTGLGIVYGLVHQLFKL